MSKFFVAFLVLSVATLYMFNSVDAACKPGPDCTGCLCDSSQPCCKDYKCVKIRFSRRNGPAICKKAI